VLLFVSKNIQMSQLVFNVANRFPMLVNDETTHITAGFKLPFQRQPNVLGPLSIKICTYEDNSQE